MSRKQNEPFSFHLSAIIWPLAFVLAIWTVFWFELRFGFDFNAYGVAPGSIKGLRGILFSPFIHGDMTHLWHNTLPLLILSAALFHFYNSVAWKVLLFGLILTGVGTWLLGRPSTHIGASGIIYMLFGFLFLKGIVARHYRLIALSFIVVFIYGSMIWYVTPMDPKISWEGHLSGLASGFVLAFVVNKGVEERPKYNWEDTEYDVEDDEFMKQFDENGIFTPLDTPEDLSNLSDPLETSVIVEESTNTSDDNTRIVYEYKPKEDVSSTDPRPPST